MARRTLLVTYIATYLLAIASIIRYLVRFRDDRFWSIAILVGGYLVLLLLEPFLIRRYRLLTCIYLLVQTAIICTISTIVPFVDFWAVLFCPLVVQVMHNFPRRTGFLITGIFTVIASVFLLLGLGLEAGLPLVFVYGVIYFLLAAFVAIILEALAARRESQKRTAELQQEVEQRAQVEEALRKIEMEKAVAAERTRLARNLHDSVSQTVFSMTLTAEAARILLDREPSRAVSELDKLQALARSALAEMRSLVFELRPTAVAEQGLIPALHHHIVILERQHDLVIALQIEGEPHLTDIEAQQLFRVIQEALNNVVKHARTDRASVGLQFEDGRVVVRIKDDGQGFAPEGAGAEGQGIGLSTMRERVEMLGGTLRIDSSPGTGTGVTVELAPESGKGGNDKD